MKYRRLTAGLLLLVMLVSLTACSTSDDLEHLLTSYRWKTGYASDSYMIFLPNGVWQKYENGQLKKEWQWELSGERIYFCYEEDGERIRFDEYFRVKSYDKYSIIVEMVEDGFSSYEVEFFNMSNTP